MSVPSPPAAVRRRPYLTSLLLLLAVPSVSAFSCVPPPSLPYPPDAAVVASLGLLASSSGDDVRGIVPSPTHPLPANPLPPAAALWIGRAFRSWLRCDPSMGVAVGRDPRVSSPRIAAAFRAGCGGRDAGLSTTPSVLEWLLQEGNGGAGAAMVTASHLPGEWNGIKLFSGGKGRGLNRTEVAEVMALAVQLAREAREGTAEGGAFGEGDALDNFMGPYVEKLRSTVRREARDSSDRPLEGMRICVNAGNGAGGFFATDVLAALGADVHDSIYLDPDGTFPHHPANPEDQAHVDATILAMANGAEVGVMLDTDVDRCGLVDGTSTRPAPVNKNRLVALCATIALDGKATGTVVTDSVTSRQVTQYIDGELGGTHDRYKMGYRNVIDRAAANPQAVLAIETSGHSAWADNRYVDDGCYTAAKILGRLAWERRVRQRPTMGPLDLLGGKLGEPQESIKVRMTIRGGLRAVPRAARVVEGALRRRCAADDDWRMEAVNHDGLRCAVELPEGAGTGWLIVRSSLHEPIVSVQTEADAVGGTAVICGKMLDEMRGECEEAGIDMGPLREAAGKGGSVE